MKWMVYYDDCNQRKIDKFNIFEHGRFREDCKKALKKCGDDKECFVEEIRRSLMYYYWAKAEWEVQIKDLFEAKYSSRGLQVDVYDQVMLNWDIFADYIWSHKAELNEMT